MMTLFRRALTVLAGAVFAVTLWHGRAEYIPFLHDHYGTLLEVLGWLTVGSISALVCEDGPFDREKLWEAIRETQLAVMIPNLVVLVLMGVQEMQALGRVWLMTDYLPFATYVFFTRTITVLVLTLFGFALRYFADMFRKQ